MFCRASVFRRFGLFDPQLVSAEFIGWFAEAMHQGIAYQVASQAVVYRRVHSQNLSRRVATNTDEYPKLVKLLLDRRRHAS
jgi:hypothetical protein